MTDPQKPAFDPMVALASMSAQFASCMIELVRGAAAQSPDLPVALQPDRESMTRKQLAELTETVARALNARGVLPGSRTIAALPSSVATGVAYLTVTTASGMLPLSPRLSAEEYERYITHVGAAAVIVQEGDQTEARAAAQKLGVAVIEIAPLDSGPAGSFEIVGAGDLSAVEPQFSGPDDLAIMLHTSGTTSKPKIVPYTNREAMTQILLGRLALQGEIGTVVVVQPLFLIGGVGMVAFALAIGSNFTVVPDQNPDQIYHYMALYKPKLLTTVPTMLEQLVRIAPQHQEELAQFRLASISVGSAALTDRLFQQVSEIFGAVVQIGYGMTEAPPLAGTVQHSGATVSYRPGSVGKPHSITQMRLVDDDFADVAQGEIGEIIVRSPLIFRGYYNNPEANAEAFRDGWFRTGDAGYLDADGFLFLVGRVKEVINRGGGKISPGDIEAVIEQHPAVAAAAAFGFPHTVLGEDLAVAVVRSDQSVSERELRQFAAERLPMNKIPSRFVFVDDLPRTDLGKVKRNSLSAQFGPSLKR